MKEYLLSKHNIDELFNLLSDELISSATLLISSKNPSVGKWGMARLWRGWMATTGKWMANNGATMPLCIDKNNNNYGTRAFNQNDAHDLFTAKWLGLDKDGIRLSWAKDDHDDMRSATKGERFICMQRHENWATNRGLKLHKPRESEYMELLEEGKDITDKKWEHGS